MKDYTKENLEMSRPVHSALECINFCLKCLYDDEKLVITDTMGDIMTIEELIGALLKSRDVLEEIEIEQEGEKQC